MKIIYTPLYACGLFLCEFNKSCYSISVAGLLLCRKQPYATVLKNTDTVCCFTCDVAKAQGNLSFFGGGVGGNVLTVKKGLQLMSKKARIEYISSLYHSVYPYHAHIYF